METVVSNGYMIKKNVVLEYFGFLKYFATKLGLTVSY
jgi:hypothetical protein